jgi:undecaprenyl-diphosphatase
VQKILELDHLYSSRISIAEKPGLLRNLAIFFAHSGDSWFWLLGLGIVWMFGADYWRVRALIMGGSIFGLALLVLMIKFTVKRKRPAGDWGDIYRKTDPHSFPSGHAARAAMLAVLAIGLGPGWLGVLLGIWAPLVILARVIMGVHYLSDVIAGALIGIVAGMLVLFLIPLLGVLS